MRYRMNPIKEYRYEMITVGQGHYGNFVEYKNARMEAQLFADTKKEPVALQQWTPKRTRPVLIRPKGTMFEKMSKMKIIGHFKKQGYDVSQYGGH